MQTGFSFNKDGFTIDGKSAFLISGEFHYFRVSHYDWERRMQLFKDAGGNCIATYVPWIIHEPEEGNICFGDVSNRDLVGFLEMAKKVGLKVLLRPGIYQYSELVNDGLPEWLLRKYPEVKAQDVYGKPFRHSSVSYLHPKLLEKARIYFKAFADQVRPYMAANGGPVEMLQVDNEATGIHLWFGSMDYNAETMGFGKPEGRYTKWLKARYETIETLNKAYETEYAAFEDVRPIAVPDQHKLCDCRRHKDYSEFYRSTIGEYFHILASWFKEDGLEAVICHNSANPGMNSLFPEIAESMGENFLLGSDHYYTLGQDWPQNNPTPQYALRVLESCETLRAMGMPPTVMELPGGSPSDTPPILPNDLLACYMTNIALGMKGMNIYVYTGGANFRQTGTTCDLYDYNALVHMNGELNETFSVLEKVGAFAKENAWLQKARRRTSVQIGFEWNTLRSEEYDWKQQWFTGAENERFIRSGLLYTLMCSMYSPEMRLLTGELDLNKPLIVPCPSAMSAAAQQAVVDFVLKGGKVLLMPDVPETDLDGNECHILRDGLRNIPIVREEIARAVYVEDVGNVYGIKGGAVCKDFPYDTKELAVDSETREIICFEQYFGEGRVIRFGGTWTMSTFPQVEMLEQLLRYFYCPRCAESWNRNIFTSVWDGENGEKMLFLMNLYSSPQNTTVFVDDWSEDFELGAMEVRAVRIR